MNIVLQKKATSEYIQTLTGAWTANGDFAHSFPNGLAAVMYCLEHRLPDMQIMARFTNSHFNFVVPVTDLRSG